MRALRPAVLAAAAVLAITVTAAIAATRSMTLEPDHGAIGTSVHLQVVDTGPHQPQRELVMWPHLSGVPECTPGDSTYSLGVIAWSGSVGTADFMIPDVPPGQYDVIELLPGVIPPCMPAGWFTVTTVPDTALETSRHEVPIAALAALVALFVIVAALRPVFRR
jgi:hypothetical protein